MNHEPIIPNASSHRAAFDKILADYRYLLEFIEPNVSNFATHSHRIYELLFRACTEFESVAKALLIYIDPKLPRKDLLDYRALDKHFPLGILDVGFTFWQPEPLIVRPFLDWTTKKPPVLDWYKAYNSVKHDRAENFDSASFEYLTFAIAGLFLAVAQTNVIRDTRYLQHPPWVYTYFENYPLYQRVHEDNLNARGL